MEKFDAIKTKMEIVEWIRRWFNANGPTCNAVVGISGGKDSSIVAALCVEALGRDRVIGVLMPNGEQKDIDVARELVCYLNIQSFEINIKDSVDGVLKQIENPSTQTIVNLPARIRMSTLYAISQSNNGRVANTCNKSEDWIGYSTRYGDSAGDFSPLSDLVVREVKEIGYLVLPKHFIDKTPEDGLSGKSDEENLGFTYDVLDEYIRTGNIEDNETKYKIDKLFHMNRFKLQLMPSFKLKDEDMPY